MGQSLILREAEELLLTTRLEEHKYSLLEWMLLGYPYYFLPYQRKVQRLMLSDAWISSEVYEEGCQLLSELLQHVQ